MIDKFVFIVAVVVDFTRISKDWYLAEAEASGPFRFPN